MITMTKTSAWQNNHQASTDHKKTHSDDQTMEHYGRTDETLGPRPGESTLSRGLF